MLSAVCCQSDSIFTIWISPLEINSFTSLKSENTFLVSMLPIPTANTQKGTEQTSTTYNTFIQASSIFNCHPNLPPTPSLPKLLMLISKSVRILFQFCLKSPNKNPNLPQQYENPL